MRDEMPIDVYAGQNQFMHTRWREPIGVYVGAEPIDVYARRDAYLTCSEPEDYWVHVREQIHW